MRCWKRVCQCQKRCGWQKTSIQETVITRQMESLGFNQWWPKLRLFLRVSQAAILLLLYNGRSKTLCKAGYCSINKYIFSEHLTPWFIGFFILKTWIWFLNAGRGRPPTEPLPDGWIMTFHNSGIPVYLHRETRVVTWSRPYFLGTGSIRVIRGLLNSLVHELSSSMTPCTHLSAPRTG